MLEILIGLPASGKSSYCKNRVKENNNIVVISSDAIREEVFGDINDQSHNQEVFNIVFKRTKEALLNNKEVILDATNLSRKRRINFIKQMPKTYFRAIVFAVPFEICCERNASRDRTVPQNVMDRMYKNFEPPFYSEGFNDIKIIKNTNTTINIDNILEENIKCSHDNPHHQHSCGEHCLMAERYIIDNINKFEFSNLHDYELVKAAARYHDVSKYKCKVFCNFKGEPSEYAHYYNHENVSAYDYLCYEKSSYKDEDLIFVANLINNHMIFFSDEVAIKKRKNIYGERFWKLLSILHEADLASH